MLREIVDDIYLQSPRYTLAGAGIYAFYALVTGDPERLGLAMAFALLTAGYLWLRSQEANRALDEASPSLRAQHAILGFFSLFCAVKYGLMAAGVVIGRVA